MPGKDDDVDPIEEAIQDLAEPGTDPQNGDEPTSEDSATNATLELLRPSKTTTVNGKTQPQAQDWEKRYKSALSGFEKQKTKLGAVETILNNPKFHEWAKSDPQVMEALAKAGYELAQKQEEQAKGEGANDRYALEIETLRQEWILDRQIQELKGQLGGELSNDALREVLQLKTEIPGLSVAQAWKLTSAYEKHVKQAQDKKVADLQKRGVVNRPRPKSSLMPGESLNMKKPVTQMNDAERSAWISETLRRTEDTR